MTILFLSYIVGFIGANLVLLLVYNDNKPVTMGMVLGMAIVSLVPLLNVVISVMALIVHLTEQGFFDRVVFQKVPK